MRYVSLYKDFVKQNIKVMLEYRIDFIIGFLSTFVLQFGGIFFIWVIFDNIKNLNGWTFYEVTFIYGMLTLAKSINHIFFDNLWVLGNQYIREGRFDTILLRPVPPLFHLVAEKLQQDGVGNLVIGAILVTKSLMELNVEINIILILSIIMFAISGGLIFAAINTIATVSSFWFVQSNMFIWSIFSLSEFAYYPITIYHRGIQMLLTWVVPYAFASYYPSTFVLHKDFGWYSFLSPIIAIVLWVIALRVWKWGLKNYTSTGS